MVTRYQGLACVVGEHAGRVVSTRAYRCGGTQSLCAVVLGRGCETCLTVANSARGVDVAQVKMWPLWSVEILHSHSSRRRKIVDGAARILQLPGKAG